jgi:hypothetical protein
MKTPMRSYIDIIEAAVASDLKTYKVVMSTRLQGEAAKMATQEARTVEAKNEAAARREAKKIIANTYPWTLIIHVVAVYENGSKVY